MKSTYRTENREGGTVPPHVKQVPHAFALCVASACRSPPPRQRRLPSAGGQADCNRVEPDGQGQTEKGEPDQDQRDDLGDRIAQQAVAIPPKSEERRVGKDEVHAVVVT